MVRNNNSYAVNDAQVGRNMTGSKRSIRASTRPPQNDPVVTTNHLTQNTVSNATDL